MDALKILCEEFGQIAGTELDLTRGPARLDIGHFGPWWIEADPSHQILTIHHEVDDAHTGDCAHWLEVNSQFPLLAGAWLAYHRPSDRIRLCALVEVTQSSGQLLINFLNNLQYVRANLPAPRTRYFSSPL